MKSERASIECKNFSLKGAVRSFASGRHWIAALFVLMVSASFSHGQSSGSVSGGRSGSRDISGFWQLNYDGKNVPMAKLLPSVAEASAEAQRDRDMYAIRWCNHLGIPAMMDTPAPLDIRVGSVEVAVASEAVSAVRHIYTDGRSHPDMATYDNQSNGHSIGHWENGVLVVDTVGFSDRGVSSIPGGGFRTETSHLTEKYQLVDGGRELSVQFTWNDPKVFAKPHSYEYRYRRAPVGTYAQEYFCDASNEERAKFLMSKP